MKTRSIPHVENCAGRKPLFCDGCAQNDTRKEAAEDAYRNAAKWCCLNGYDTKFPQVEEIRQKLLAQADNLRKSRER